MANQGTATSHSQRLPFRRRIEDALYCYLGDDWCGNTAAPGSTLGADLGQDSLYVASVRDDGGTLYMGTPHEWKLGVDRTEARRLAVFVLWTWWAKGEWFGLRRFLWYRLLFLRVNRHKRVVAAMRISND